MWKWSKLLNFKIYANYMNDISKYGGRLYAYRHIIVMPVQFNFQIIIENNN